MKVQPYQINLNRQNVTSYNGVASDGSQKGFVSIQGLYCFIYRGEPVAYLGGKFGVAHYVRDKKPFKARFTGVLDTFQTMLCAPVSLIAHSVLFAGSGATTIVTLPFTFTKKGKKICKTSGAFCVTNAVTVGCVAANALTTPIEIVAPEFNIKVMKVDKWGIKG